ncbi:hypothetical protein CIL05_07785 [Virgibacillus profundi]|uniref:IDEAL domain-containing protein n=1 Tax=Virgibacillus profundi TaxID=2024555 RepID=A0A2A2IGZ5_9BACI|nr:IDEAL domain-containing protein [Virgibacillus profundi]PAV30363.1 hypothetical protein CIL05_07785 [Virgibacillus profundi]PXY54535.1 IDEAL domain-containing protein [Virgibacillus profundi]
MKFKVNERVAIKDTELEGVITDVFERRSVNILGDTTTIKYKVQCIGQPLMLFREDQLYRKSEKSIVVHSKRIDKDASIPLKLEIELLDTLIDGSLDRDDKEAFEEYTKMKKVLLDVYENMDVSGGV